MHTGMVYPPFKIFTKLADKNAIKPEKGVPSQKKFHSPYIPSTSEICHKRQLGGLDLSRRGLDRDSRSTNLDCVSTNLENLDMS
jgi:hypothetical protein